MLHIHGRPRKQELKNSFSGFNVCSVACSHIHGRQQLILNSIAFVVMSLFGPKASNEQSLVLKGLFGTDSSRSSGS